MAMCDRLTQLSRLRRSRLVLPATDPSTRQPMEIAATPRKRQTRPQMRAGRRKEMTPTQSLATSTENLHGSVTAGSVWLLLHPSTAGPLDGAWTLCVGNLVLLSAQQFVDCVTSVSGCHGGLMDNATKGNGFPRL